MRGFTRAVAAAGAAALLTAGMLAGCGSGNADGGGPSRPAPSPNGLERDTSSRVVKRVAAALRDARTVHLALRMADGNTIDARIRGEDMTSRLGARGRTAEVVTVGGTTYVKGDPDVLIAFGFTRVAALHAGDRWVRARQELMREFPIEGLRIDTLARLIDADDTPVRPGVAAQRLNGAPVAVVTEEDGSKLYAASTGTPYPLRLADDTASGDFSEFGAAVTVTAPAGAVDPAGLPPAGTIVFLGDQDGAVDGRPGVINLYAVKPDGTGRRQISHFLSGALDRPSLSPDGTRVVFQRVEDDKQDADIWIINTDGSDARKLTPNVAHEGSATWSPDGRTIVFTSDRAGRGIDELYQMNPDGTDVRQLTHRGRNTIDPAYALDGGTIAFLDCRTNMGCRLWVGPAAGTARQVSDARLTNARPAWSPDGSKIAVVAHAGDGYDVLLVNADGSGTHPLTADHLSADPAWSADGTAIAFTNIRDGNPSLYVMRPDGSGVRRLTQPAPGTHDAEPTWQR